MYCNNCGNANAEGRFCDICGAELVSEYGDTELLTEEPAVQSGYAPTSAPVNVSDPGKTLGKIGMILGIIGAVLSVVCCVFNVYGICFPFAVAGLILSIIGSKKSKAVGITNKNAKIGLILSIIALVMYVLMTIAFVVIYVLGIASSSAYYY